jgi:2-polyprenyl-3-methyl-5-hydroxy-6-metoxy-1,4-benzoquinol methylase
VNSSTAERLIALNHRFYVEHSRDFSETRARLQPGVLRLLNILDKYEAILDFGCGNGELAHSLSRRGHQGSYLGLDFSIPLLNEAEREAFTFPVKFLEADLTAFPMNQEQLSVSEKWPLVTAFAVLHHIPGFELRLNIVKKIHEMLIKEGLFIHSNWQFLGSPRLKARIQPWESIGLSEQNVDANDYLLDWKRGLTGLRYVHHFNEQELADLANAGRFEIVETFYSDGENRKLSLYQIWKKA